MLCLQFLSILSTHRVFHFGVCTRTGTASPCSPPPRKAGTLLLEASGKPKTPLCACDLTEGPRKAYAYLGCNKYHFTSQPFPGPFQRIVIRTVLGHIFVYVYKISSSHLTTRVTSQLKRTWDWKFECYSICAIRFVNCCTQQHFIRYEMGWSVGIDQGPISV